MAVTVLEETQLEEIILRAGEKGAEKAIALTFKPLKEVMSLSEIAEYLSVSENTVREKIKSKGFPVSEKLGFKRFYRSQVDEWMKAK